MQLTDEQIVIELQNILAEAIEVKERILGILPQSQESQNNISNFEMLINGYTAEVKANADLSKQAVMDAKADAQAIEQIKQDVMQDAQAADIVYDHLHRRNGRHYAERRGRKGPAGDGRIFADKPSARLPGM